MADADPQAEMVLELAEEFLARYRKGERPSLREYIDRHPDLASEIKEVFPAMAMMENIAVADESLAAPAPRTQASGIKDHRIPPLGQLGDFRIIREVGRGGMGVVYEAEQISLGRHVALKVLRHKALADAKTRKRFEREARAAAKLHHTNIVPVFGVGEHEELPYYVMQFIQGLGMDLVLEELKRLNETGGNAGQVASLPHSRPEAPSLSNRDLSAADMARSLLTGDFHAVEAPAPGDIRTSEEPPEVGHSHPSTTKDSLSSSSGTLSLSSGSISLPGQSGPAPAPRGKGKTYWHSVAQTGLQVADALEYAHKQGIIHRDIKPSNLLLDTRGTVWVTDFGLAKADDQQDLTHAGDLLGTLRYMPPEAFDGKADGRGDVYSLGLTLYELLALRPAFDERDRNRLVKKVTTEEPARLDRLNRRVPRDLVTIIHKAIARDPAHRYQTPAEMAEDLKRFGEDRPIRARRVSDGERLWRWCRRNPLPASLLACTVLMFLIGFAGVFWQWRVAETARADEESQRQQAEVSRVAAEAETYRALLSEVRALRVGREPGWRDKALGGLARLAVMSTPRRDLTELRTEAAATLATPDIDLVAKVELPSDDVASFTFSPDGRTLVTARSPRGLDFWDVLGNRHLSSVEGLTVSKSNFARAVYLPDGQGLAVATRDYGVVFTDTRGIRTGRAPITHGSSQPAKLAISGNRERIAVAWSDGADITIHDAATGALLDTFKDSSPTFALSPDGKWLARLEDFDIVLLPIASGEARIVLGRHRGANALAFSPNGAVLAAGCQDHTTVLWDVAKREQFGTLRGHRERVLDVAFSPDGQWIATAGLDYTARIWDTRTGQNLATLSGSSSPAFRVLWSPTGDQLAVSMHNAREIFLYKITGRNGVQQWLTGHRVELGQVAAHPRLDRLATSGYTELNGWDLSVPWPAPVAFEPNPGAVTSLAYSPDGSLLASASWPQTANPSEVAIRDADTGKIRTRFSRPWVVWALAFDPTGERLACGDIAGNIVVWDVHTNRFVQQLATGSTVYSILFLGARSLVTHGKDSILLFDLESGKLERKVDLAGGGIKKLAADEARRRLVVGFQSGAISSFSLPGLAPGPRLENAHNSSVECLALSPDGRLLASASDHRVVLRDAMSFETLLSLPIWAGTVRNLTFDSKGRHLAIVGTDSDVDLWDLAALREGLTALGLAWDRPASADVPAPGLVPQREYVRPEVPVIRAAPLGSGSVRADGPVASKRPSREPVCWAPSGKGRSCVR